MAAGIATLCQLKANRQGFYKQLDEMAGNLVAGVTLAAKEAGIAMTANRVGSMFTFFFTDRQVTDWQSASTCDTVKFGRFHGALLDAESGCHLRSSRRHSSAPRTPKATSKTQSRQPENVGAAVVFFSCHPERGRAAFAALTSRRTAITRPDRSFASSLFPHRCNRNC